MQPAVSVFSSQVGCNKTAVVTLTWLDCRVRHDDIQDGARLKCMQTGNASYGGCKRATGRICCPPPCCIRLLLGARRQPAVRPLANPPHAAAAVDR